MKSSLKNCTMPFEKECNVHFRMSNSPFKGAVPLLEKPIFLQYMQYCWHRASLSKVQHVWTVSTIKECSFASHHWTTEYCPCMAKKTSCGEAPFLENWITFVWHVYSSPWSDEPSLHLDNSHLKKCFQYNPTIMFSFNQISHSYQGGVAQIQQQILQGRPYSFKRVLHAYSIPYAQTMFACLKI